MVQDLFEFDANHLELQLLTIYKNWGEGGIFFKPKKVSANFVHNF